MGGGVFFAEETSLAACPAVPLELLERRLHMRLATQGITVRETHHIERCLFPMNLPLPDMRLPIMGYGGAASMVHPASGYQVGAALRYAPLVANAVAAALGAGGDPAQAARAAWGALWPAERLRRRGLYLFGLACLLRFDTAQLQKHFTTFFHLPLAQWSGYLSDRLTTPELVQTMLRLFIQAPWPLRTALARSAGSEAALLLRTLNASAR
jgi:lycopene beta-cyclase